MSRTLFSGLLVAAVLVSVARMAVADDGANVPLQSVSIVADDALPPAMPVMPVMPAMGVQGAKHDAALDDFYGRKKSPDKKLKVSPPPGKGKLAPAPAEDVYGEVPLPPTTLDDEFGGQMALPEVVQKAVLSRSDVNRIICPEPVKDVISSEEKGIISRFYGNSVYIKFDFQPVGEKIVYSTNPVELHIICGNTTYSLVAVPMPVPPQVIRLGSGKVVKARENDSLFKGDDTSKKIRELIRRAYKDEFPESFDTKKFAVPINLFRDMDILLSRTTVIDGEGITVKEFIVTSKVDGLELREKMFLRKEISANPAAIALEPGKQRPAKGEPVRLFIVEFKSSPTLEGAANVE